MRLAASLTSSILALAACGDAGGASTDGASEPATSDAPATSDVLAPTTTTGEVATADPETSASTGADAEDVPGCGESRFLPVPEDTSLPGPWPVGARTASVAGRTVEVWYPAEPGSELGVEAARYDIRAALPESEQGKVPDADAPFQACACRRDLPLDAAHGPYPVVVFVHGTAGFRSQSLEHVTHWASRGFVVVAADHPGLWLKDLLGSLCGGPTVAQDLAADLEAVIAGLAAPAGDLEFLAGHLDAARLGMAGHSAGGGAIAGFGGAAQVLIPMAAGGVQPGEALRSTLVLGAQSDQVVAYSQQQSGYASSPAPKRLVGIAGAGHLAFSSLCSLKNAAGEDFLQIAEANAVCGAQLAGALFDCDPTYTPDATGWAIVHAASSAALEETLRCRDVSAVFAGLQSTYPEVGELQESL